MDNNGLLTRSAIIIGDALEVTKRIADNYVDCCITSPPYYGLRDYGVLGQIGQEESPEEYIEKLVILFREIRRILRPDGTLWVNIGDCYSGSGKGRLKDGTHSMGKSKSSDYEGVSSGFLKKTKSNCKDKDLIGIPWMLAFALRADGWYLRQEIIWQKPNAMPESVKDRCTRSHEHIFMLAKSKTYYYNAEAIKETCVNGDPSRPRGSRGTERHNAGLRKQDAVNKSTYTGFNERYFSGEKRKYRNKRDVWTVSTAGFKGAHFATFPERLIVPCVLAGSREGGTIIDPFFGAGTTGKVAKDNGRAFIGIEINVDYAKISADRTGIDLCANCLYNTNDFVCRPECSGCNGVSKFAERKRTEHGK